MNTQDESDVAVAASKVGRWFPGVGFVIGILVIGATYFVCPPGIFDTTFCVQVTKSGINAYVVGGGLSLISAAKIIVDIFALKRAPRETHLIFKQKK